jgi:two-component system, OmpR family, sensor histidine kinase KdpD
MRNAPPRRPLPAFVTLPAGFSALLVTGAVAAGLHGRFSGTGVLAVTAVIVAAGAVWGEPAAAGFLAVVGWLTVTGFSAPPYARLHPAGAASARAVLVLAGSCLAGVAAGLMMRRSRPSFTLVGVNRRVRRWLVPGHGAGLRARRRVAGVLLVAGLPLVTMGLVTLRGHLALSDVLLIYLVAVVAIAVVGGFWPAVLAAVTASLLVNWYFTRPLHTFTIAEPQSLLALLIFVTVAVTVSSVVHLAARRAVQAARSGEDAASLLALAQTVLGGQDTPAAVLGHLTRTWGGWAELTEKTGDKWVPVARSGSTSDDAPVTSIEVADGLTLLVAGQQRPITPRLLDGFAAQAGAALDRDRLRTQAAQAEALAEGNRIRTALLAAVSHDLRTPLASIKASVSTLRQTDVEWTPADESALLAAIEEGADRLDSLIGNLLDASRLTTGSLRPFLRPTSIDEVAPVALRGLGQAAGVRLAVPDGLPLVRTDPGLLERVLANLLSNALTHSPSGSPPELRASAADGHVVVDIRDYGPGVPDHLKTRIFEPFERLDERGSGVGLGLAVAKGFLDAMGGSVTAADTPGGGLTMRVTLPVATAPASSPAAADQ